MELVPQTHSAVPRRSFLLGSAALGVGASLGILGPRGLTSAAQAEPSIEDIIDDVVTSHPRLLLNDFDALRTKVDAVARLGTWAAQIVEQADAMLSTPVQPYEIPDGLRMTHSPVILRSYTLAFSYQITEDERYAERLWDELENAAGWPNWNPAHFLDTAGMTHAFAIGLDWMHDYWSQDRRELLSSVIISMGLEPGLAQYTDGAFWTRAAHNWNAVCNGGLTMGSLAVAHEAPELAGELIRLGLENVPRAAEEYAPDGGYPEGIGYWSYGTRYLVLYLASLVSASGSAYGMEDSPGLSATGYFPIDVTSTAGLPFNYYDSGMNVPRPSAYFWLAAQYGEPALTDWATPRADAEPEVRDIIWYEPSHTVDAAERWRDRSLDHRYSPIEVATSRSSWHDPSALFVAIKGGSNQTNHSDLDLGTFVLDALGTRWAVDLGSDDYNLPGYFGAGVGGQRWQYYRKRSEGSNTLVAAPGEGGGQAELARAEIVRNEGSAEGTITIVDLSQATEAMSSWQRGVRMMDHRRHVIIQDEFVCTAETDVWWFMHTTATVVIAEDGRSVELNQPEGQLLLRLLGDDDKTFVHLPAKGLWTSPDPSGQNPNAGISKLAIRLQDVESGTIAVQAIPVRPGQPIPPEHDPLPLADWELDMEGWRLRGLDIDGVPLPQFRPDVFDYRVEVEEDSAPPRVEASVRGRKRIQQASEVPGVATLTVGAGRRERTYTVRFEHPRSELRPGIPVIASSNDGNLPENVVDDDLGTRWSAQGSGEWIRLDLGEVVAVDAVAIAWHQGTSRAAYFSVEVSDGDQWVTVLSDQTSQLVDGMETFEFPATQARYVRYTGYGNSTNMWNSITEFQVPGHPVHVPAPPARLDRVTLDAPPAVTLGTDVTVHVGAELSTGETVELVDGQVEVLSLDPDTAQVVDNTLTGIAPGQAQVAAVVEVDRALAWATADVTVLDPDLEIVATDADASVRSGAYSDDNIGGAHNLSIKNDGNADYHREAYIKIPAAQTRTLASAELELSGRITDGSTGAVLGVLATAADWDEETITWTTRPEMGDVLGSVELSGTMTTYRIDVTEYLRGAVEAGLPVAFGLQQLREATQPGININVAARESGNPATLRLRLV